MTKNVSKQNAPATRNPVSNDLGATKESSTPGSVFGSEPGQKVAPTQEQVQAWVKRDLEAAHYFLGLLLQYPEVIAIAAKEIREHVLRKENGAGIDHVKGAQ